MIRYKMNQTLFEVPKTSMIIIFDLTVTNSIEQTLFMSLNQALFLPLNQTLIQAMHQVFMLGHLMHLRGHPYP